jgi:hypothetical protein
VRLACRLAVLLPLLAASVHTAQLAAQEKPATLRLRGITFDHWDAVGSALLRPTLRATNLAGGWIGPDFALTLFPDGISIHPPVVTAGIQAGAALRVPAGPASLLLKGGGAGIVAAGPLNDQLLHLIPGLHWGLGLLLPIDAKSQIHVDLTRHLYVREGRGTSLWSIGFGFAAPRRSD